MTVLDRVISLVRELEKKKSSPSEDPVEKELTIIFPFLFIPREETSGTLGQGTRKCQ